MRIAGQIAVMVERLERYQIPRDSLCYELDEREWEQFGEEIRSVCLYPERDISYVDQVTFMGMRVRKRSS